MRWRSPFWRLTRRFGTPAALAFLLLWLTSGWTYLWYGGIGHDFWLSQGYLAIGRTSTGMGGRGFRVHSLGTLRPRWIWSVKHHTLGANYTCNAYPLWIAGAPLLAVTAFAWMPDSRAARRQRHGRCRTCGYDRAGLPLPTTCPECGSPGTAALLR